MIRKILLGAGALALMALMTGLGVGVGADAASASGTPVTMTGPITCTVHGRYTFTTPLKNGGTKPTDARIYLQLINCTGAGTKKGTVKVTSGILTASSLTAIPNNCGSIMAGNPFPLMLGSVTWTTTGGKAAATKVEITTPWIYYNYNSNILVIGLPTTITSGSYFHEKPTFSNLFSNGSGGNITGTCGTAQPGLATFPFGQPKTGAVGSVTIKGV